MHGDVISMSITVRRTKLGHTDHYMPLQKACPVNLLDDLAPLHEPRCVIGVGPAVRRLSNGKQPTLFGEILDTDLLTCLAIQWIHFAIRRHFALNQASW